jgi:hypothetical protein
MRFSRPKSATFNPILYPKNRQANYESGYISGYWQRTQRIHIGKRWELKSRSDRQEKRGRQAQEDACHPRLITIVTERASPRRAHNDESQLPRRNYVVECRVVRRFGREYCPETPRSWECGHVPNSLILLTHLAVPRQNLIHPHFQ